MVYKCCIFTVAMKKNKSYFDYLLQPFSLLRTKDVLRVNPTVIPERTSPVHPEIYQIDYDTLHHAFNRLHTVEEAFAGAESSCISWINVDGLDKSGVEKICTHYGVHPLIMEDILSRGQRPKMDEINGLLFCLLSMMYYNEETKAVETEQVSLVLGKRFVLSFQEIPEKDVFQQIRDKLKIPESKLRQNGADFLFYALIDAIVDHYYLVMERLGENIELLEEEVIRSPNTRSLAHITQIRKEMIVLKRNIAPVRELISGILRSETDLIEVRTEKYFKDVYDHIIQANDLAENYRDMVINLQDLYLSNVNLKLNEVMKVMAIVTCLLAPATVVGGIFGMNFDRIPLLHNQWGFFISVAIMLVVPIGMIVIFKRRGWF